MVESIWTLKTPIGYSINITYISHRALASNKSLFLPGHVGIPVAHQAVILDTVVLMPNQPVRVHFAFTLKKKRDRFLDGFKHLIYLCS